MVNKKQPNLSLNELYKLREAYRHFQSMNSFVRAINELIDIREAEKKTVAIYEIAPAAITAPDTIPPHVLDAMSDMCDGGFNAQGIWDLCRESIMPAKPCPRCGTVSERPDGAHYCHIKGKGK